jgi:hypothetical protein
LASKRAPPGFPRIEYKLTLSSAGNPDFLGPIQRVTGDVESPKILTSDARHCFANRPVAIYSAAAAKDGFIFADDTMKSEIRGTISDLKREPLNTP